mmetsp:Transcript_79747/g.140686  ORF Transcript_79747/g.140686 Transcript_79747/m.140686 type:complete len:230 (-) Transcript_79747:1014-1703(-)
MDWIWVSGAMNSSARCCTASKDVRRFSADVGPFSADARRFPVFFGGFFLPLVFFFGDVGEEGWPVFFFGDVGEEGWLPRVLTGLRGDAGETSENALVRRSIAMTSCSSCNASITACSRTMKSLRLLIEYPGPLGCFASPFGSAFASAFVCLPGFRAFEGEGVLGVDEDSAAALRASVAGRWSTVGGPSAIPTDRRRMPRDASNGISSFWKYGWARVGSCMVVQMSVAII